MRDKANFKAEEDVSALRKAIEGLGTLLLLLHICQYHSNNKVMKWKMSSVCVVPCLQARLRRH